MLSEIRQGLEREQQKVGTAKTDMEATNERLAASQESQHFELVNTVEGLQLLSTQTGQRFVETKNAIKTNNDLLLAERAEQEERVKFCDNAQKAFDQKMDDLSAEAVAINKALEVLGKEAQAFHASRHSAVEAQQKLFDQTIDQFPVLLQVETKF